MVGRSNVGKSSLINALMRRTVARTSATPGKTRLINLYRVVTPPTGPFYLVDLPGYGYTRGPQDAKQEFDRLATMYFARAMPTSSGVRSPKSGVGSPTSDTGHRTPDHAIRATPIGVLLALDARHPGMESDLATLRWLRDRGFGSIRARQAAEPQDVAPLHIVVTKVDKVSRNERAKALDRFEQLCEQPVLAVSAATGEGMEDLWKRIASWAASQAANSRPRSRP